MLNTNLLVKKGETFETNNKIIASQTAKNVLIHVLQKGTIQARFMVSLLESWTKHNILTEAQKEQLREFLKDETTLTEINTIVDTHIRWVTKCKEVDWKNKSDLSLCNDVWQADVAAVGRYMLEEEVSETETTEQIDIPSYPDCFQETVENSPYKEKLIAYIDKYGLEHDENTHEFRWHGLEIAPTGASSHALTDKTKEYTKYTTGKWHGHIEHWKKDSTYHLIPGVDRGEGHVYVSYNELDPEHDLYDAHYKALMDACGIESVKEAQNIFRDMTWHNWCYMTDWRDKWDDSTCVAHDFFPDSNVRSRHSLGYVDFSSRGFRSL